MNQIYQNVIEYTGKDEDFSHSFFFKVKEILQAGDHETLLKEKIPLKLLRLTPHAQEGFILTDFPSNVTEAELLEQYRGGMNCFVHLSLPDEVLVDIEESKLVCKESGRYYYPKDIIKEEHGIHIESFVPKDGFCFDSGSNKFEEASDPASFEQQLSAYKESKDELLSFYNHFVFSITQYCRVFQLTLS